MQQSLRSDAKTDAELLKGAYQQMLRDKQWVIDHLEKEQQEALEKHEKLAEKYEQEAANVNQAMDELDGLVEDGTDPEAVKAAREKLTAAEGRMTTALKQLAKLQARPEIQQIIRQEREIQRKRTRAQMRESINKRELRKRVTTIGKALNSVDFRAFLFS